MLTADQLAEVLKLPWGFSFKYSPMLRGMPYKVSLCTLLVLLPAPEKIALLGRDLRPPAEDTSRTTAKERYRDRGLNGDCNMHVSFFSDMNADIHHRW